MECGRIAHTYTMDVHEIAVIALYSDDGAISRYLALYQHSLGKKEIL